MTGRDPTTDADGDDALAPDADFELEQAKGGASMEHTGSSEPMPSFLKDEVAPILAAAERAASQIVDRAREQARQDTEELERARRQMETRLAELNAWQERIDPSVRTLQSQVADIQAKIEQVPELIRRALDPVATAISSLDPTLAEVSAASRPLLNMEPIGTDHHVGGEDANL